MRREIKVGGRSYTVNCSPEAAEKVLNKIIEWMEHPDHYAAYSGEAIMQSDNTLIDAPDLISDIVDDILEPVHQPEEDGDEY